MNSASIIVAAVNAFWQGTLIVGLAALALRLLRRVNAATACTIWTAAFVTIALLPAVNLVVQRSTVEKTAAPAPAAWSQALSVPVRALRARSAQVERAASTPQAEARFSRINVVHARYQPPTASTMSSPAAPLPHWSAHAALIAFAAATSSFAGQLGAVLIFTWAVVAFVLLVALVRDYAALRRLKRSAVPLQRISLERVPRCAGGRRVRICTSEQVRVPCAAGFLHPMVLLPHALVDGLADEDLLRIILHEIGHLQRFDDWLHAAERVLRAIFFFQPALWYVGSRIAFERELACDDRVLAQTGEPLRYAECLTNIVERHILGRRRFAPVPGFLLGRNQVVGRIARLVDRGRNGSVRVPRIAGLAACAAFALAVGIMLPLQVPLFAACTDRVRSATHIRNTPVHQRLASRPKRRVPGAMRASVRVAIAAVPQRHSHCMHATADPAVAMHHRMRVTVVAARVAAAHAALAHAVAAGTVARRSRTDASSLAVATNSLAEADAVVAAASSAVISAAHARAGAEVAGKVAARASDLLDALSAAGMHPSVDELIELHDHTVSAELVYAIADSRIAQPAVADLVASADRGINRPMLIAAVQAFGPSIPLRDIANLRDAGVTPAYLNALVPLKPRGFSVLDTVALAENGVTPAYIVALQGAGYARFDARALVQLHDNGVDAVFLRSLAQHGLHDLPLGRIIQLHGSGENS